MFKSDLLWNKNLLFTMNRKTSVFKKYIIQTRKKI